MHPLIDDFQDLTDVELNEKIADLSQKYWKTPNPDVKNQMIMILDQLKEEQRIRMQKNVQNSLDQDNKDLDNLINIS
jgi:3-methyladenine DNA glycosylase AlkC